MFPFSSLVVVIVSTEISLPGDPDVVQRSESPLEDSALLAPSLAHTVAPPEKTCPKADWITSDTWAALELHRECRHHFFERIRQHKSLLLRLAFLAWSPSTFDQALKAKVDLGGNRLVSAL